MTNFVNGVVSNFGAWLSFGAIGLGLALATIAAYLMYSLHGRSETRPPTLGERNLISRFMIFGFGLVLIGASLEVYKSYESRRIVDAQYLVLQTLPEDMWRDLVELRRLRATAGGNPTGDVLENVDIDVREVKELRTALKPNDCRRYFAIVRPPSKVLVKLSNNDASFENRARGDFQETGLICSAKGTEAVLEISVTGARSRLTSEFYIAPPLAPSVGIKIPTNTSAERTSVKKTACVGEIAGRCGNVDLHLPCYSGSDQQIADNVCAVAGAKNRRLSTFGGNRCGYALIEITCN